MTSKERVLATLEFRNTADRVPRQLWSLPWAQDCYPDMMRRLEEEFEWDFSGPEAVLKERPKTKGDAYTPGEYVDEWGCVFTNIHKGVIGEVKQPIVVEEDWSDAGNVHIPEELLSFDIDQVNRSCQARQDKFLMSGCCPRPFEQLQFIRGTADLYMDLMDPPQELLEFMKRMHDYYCRLMTKWAKTDVDALNMMDDWGSQNDLLISPALWEEFFMPMYRDYIQIAHSHGKKIFMHSDGNILRIIPGLIDLGLDAVNSSCFAWEWKTWRRTGGKSRSGEKSTDSICCPPAAGKTSTGPWSWCTGRCGRTAAASPSANSGPGQIRTTSTAYSKNGAGSAAELICNLRAFTRFS